MPSLDVPSVKACLLAGELMSLQHSFTRYLFVSFLSYFHFEHQRLEYRIIDHSLWPRLLVTIMLGKSGGVFHWYCSFHRVLTIGRAQGRTAFDQSAAHPVFVKFLKSDIARELGVPKSRKALVPGCGRVSQ